ncbi:uncharacterized protein ASPGLDRAFT_26849 [Aspergillus glaucus CBS 516.65]|uniref:Uncharacterized protein n=1 Tax=Aspergillus glaucus CBS 516.65 TaxID=1160497 RepID=A0A1L9VHC0_ASPGL|nr:hypothetical protein ASPGLDRAFT_26849 [Aspergillus glaucus CBS 516.65]OJJ83272.1 hypothetical protein ASPGLDRAFT_26849 [Aspergillus glaucus CBS 516.65]
MSTFNFPRHKRQSLGSRYRPLSETSQFLLQNLGGSSEPLPQNYPVPPPRVGTFEDDYVLCNRVSGLMDVDYLRDRDSIGSDLYSERGSLYVVNSGIETQSINSEGSVTSDISIGSESEAELPACLTPGRISNAQPPSDACMGIQDFMEEVSQHCDSYFDDSGVDIAPAPLRPRKRQNNKKRPHKTYRAFKKTKFHFDEHEADDHSHEKRAQPAVEEAIEQHLAQLEHQTAELREMLTACESKLSQMTEQLAQSKSEKQVVSFKSSFEPKTAKYNALPVKDNPFPIVEYKNESRRHGDAYMDFLRVDFMDAEQVDLLSYVNNAGLNAQQRRGRLPRAWAA